MYRNIVDVIALPCGINRRSTYHNQNNSDMTVPTSPLADMYRSCCMFGNWNFSQPTKSSNKKPGHRISMLNRPTKPGKKNSHYPFHFFLLASFYLLHTLVKFCSIEIERKMVKLLGLLLHLPKNIVKSILSSVGTLRLRKTM